MSGLSHRIFLRRARHHAPFWLVAAGGCSAVLAGQRLRNESNHDKNNDVSVTSTVTHCESPTPTAASSSSSSASNDHSNTNTTNKDDDDDYPNFSRHGPQAILPRLLTPQLYQQLKTLQTPTHGVRLEDMISAGTMLPWGATPPRGVGGVYAGDAECYQVFAPLLIPLVEEYHGVILERGGGGGDATGSNKTSNQSGGPASRRSSFVPPPPTTTTTTNSAAAEPMALPGGRKSSKLKRHTTNLNPDQILDTQLDPTGEYILYTRMRLARNLDGFAFAPSILRKDRRRIERLFRTIVQEDFQPLQGGAYLPIHSMTNEQHEDYVTRRMCFLDPDEFKLAAGLGYDWPDGRGIYCCSHWDPHRIRRHYDNSVSSSQQQQPPSTDIEQWEESPPNISFWCNYDDHFWIISVHKGGDVQSVFTCLSDAVRQLELSLLERGHTFCVDPKLGFLTCSPANVGTALRASMSVKLVRLGREHPKLFAEILHRLHLEAKSDYAETDQRYTGIFDIANAERLGRTEVQWINIMIQGISKLIELEKKLEGGETVTLQDVDYVVKTVVKES